MTPDNSGGKDDRGGKGQDRGQGQGQGDERRPGRPETGNGTVKRTRYQDIQSAKRGVERALRKKANVHAVAIGHKEVKGKDTDELAIIVHVTSKVAEADLKQSDIVPKRIKLADGKDIPTDVRQSDIPTVDSSPTPYRRQDHNPVFGGLILRPNAAGRGSGTLGAPVETEDGSIRLLTNRHVATTVSGTPSVGEEILQGSETVAATLSEWSPISDTEMNVADSALLEPVAGIGVANHIASVGEMGSPVVPSIGDECVISSMVDDTATSTVRELDYTGSVGYDGGSYVATFEGLINLRDPHVAGPGSSGAVWGRYDEATEAVRPIGIIFAGSEGTGNQLCTPWQSLETVHGNLTPVSAANETAISPKNVANSVEVAPIKFETEERAILKCVGARYGDPANLPEAEVSLHWGELDSNGQATGEVLDTHRITSGWGEPERLEFGGLEETLGEGLHIVSLGAPYLEDSQYEILVTEVTEHRVYGSIMDADGNSIADATVDVYTN